MCIRDSPSLDMNTKLNDSNLTHHCRIMTEIIMHNVLTQEGHFDKVKSDSILLLYALKKKMKVNIEHAFVRNLMGDKGNIEYRMMLTKVFKMIDIDLKSKTFGKMRVTSTSVP